MMTEDEEDEGDEVCFHFDADHGLEDQAPNLLLHPRLATVTYLTDFGAPSGVDVRSNPPDVSENIAGGDIRKGWSHQTWKAHGLTGVLESGFILPFLDDQISGTNQ
jgi:hypothetical protein